MLTAYEVVLLGKAGHSFLGTHISVQCVKRLEEKQHLLQPLSLSVCAELPAAGWQHLVKIPLGCTDWLRAWVYARVMNETHTEENVR